MLGSSISIHLTLLLKYISAFPYYGTWNFCHMRFVFFKSASQFEINRRVTSVMPTLGHKGKEMGRKFRLLLHSCLISLSYKKKICNIFTVHYKKRKMSGLFFPFGDRILT